ncbi:30S ribosomal protein S8 [soil metagenome]
MSITDLVIRLKNGYMSKKESITVPYSKYRISVLQKLKELNYISSFDFEGDVIKIITVQLRYDHGEAAITDVKIFSKPGRRWYTPYKEIRPVLGGMGKVILSSSKGIITDKEAKKERVGGELLFHIW